MSDCPLGWGRKIFKVLLLIVCTVSVSKWRHSAVPGTFRRELSRGGADVRHQRRLITGKYTLRSLISQLEDTGDQNLVLVVRLEPMTFRLLAKALAD